MRLRPGVAARVTSTSPLAVRPRSHSTGSPAGAVCRTSSSLRARPDPDDRSSSASTPAWTPIVSPPDPVVRSIRPASASATETAPVPVRTPTSARTSPMATSPLPALMSVDPATAPTRTVPEPVRIRARPPTAPSTTSPEPVVTSASPSTSAVVAVPAPVRTVARPARPVTATSPAPVRAVTRDPAGAQTVTTRGTIRNGSSVVDRTVSVGASPPAPGADQVMSVARTASAPAETGPSPASVSGAAPTEPSHDATSPRRWAHPPAAAGSCRTSTRISSSPGAFAPAASSSGALVPASSRCTSTRPTSTATSRSAGPATVRLSCRTRSSMSPTAQPSTQPRR